MKKVLVAYFSHEGEAYVGGKIVKLKIGNTRVAAQMIHGLTGGASKRRNHIRMTIWKP